MGQAQEFSECDQKGMQLKGYGQTCAVWRVTKLAGAVPPSRQKWIGIEPRWGIWERMGVGSTGGALVAVAQAPPAATSGRDLLEQTGAGS